MFFVHTRFISIKNILICLIFKLLVLTSSAQVKADGIVVDKVYHPYVEQGTYEFETRLISQLDSELAANFSVYRFGFGKDVSENLFIEFYLIGAKDTDKNIEVEAYEIEALYQFTEQGEYWLDVGFLVEIERESDSKEWEGNFAVILEKEFGRWSSAINIHNQYLFEDDKTHEWEFSQSFQLRYRYTANIEPGFEIYFDNKSTFFGPVIMGEVTLDKSKLNWEIGILQKIENSKNDSVLRALIEYEF